MRRPSARTRTRQARGARRPEVPGRVAGCVASRAVELRDRELRAWAVDPLARLTLPSSRRRGRAYETNPPSSVMFLVMRARRLVSLLLLLQTRGQRTAAELADRFEVSIRTIHRDIEALGDAGVPVEAVRGPAGGYRLARGYRTRLTGLTAEEAEALFAAPAAELGLGRVLADARLKVLAALPAELQERAERSARLFHLDTRGWFRGEDRTPHLPLLASAVWQGKRVRARYREGPRVVQRTVDPLGLVLKAGAWYLVARRSVGMRVYRVSRFASVRILGQSFQRPSDFDLSA